VRRSPHPSAIGVARRGRGARTVRTSELSLSVVSPDDGKRSPGHGCESGTARQQRASGSPINTRVSRIRCQPEIMLLHHGPAAASNCCHVCTHVQVTALKGSRGGLGEGCLAVGVHGPACIASDSVDHRHQARVVSCPAPSSGSATMCSTGPASPGDVRAQPMERPCVHGLMCMAMMCACRFGAEEDGMR
jgi:hypothetical protein